MCATFVRLLLFCLLFGGSICDETIEVASEGPQHVHLSYHDSTNEDVGVYVTWYTRREGGALLDFSLAPSNPSSSTPTEPQQRVVIKGISTQLTYGDGFIHRVLVRGLKPNYRYQYR